MIIVIYFSNARHEFNFKASFVLDTTVVSPSGVIGSCTSIQDLMLRTQSSASSNDAACSS